MRSMTGFGSSKIVRGDYSVKASFRSVNHRYLDIDIKLPSALYSIENAIKRRISEKLSRGKIELCIWVEDNSEGAVEAKLNKNLSKEIFNAVSELQNDFNLSDEINLFHLLTFPDIIIVEKSDEKNDNLNDSVFEALDAALDELISDRLREGKFLYDDIEEKLSHLELLYSEIDKEALEIEQNEKKNLKAKMDGLLDEYNLSIPEDRLLTELAILLDKRDISEELSRLSSHLETFGNIMLNEEIVGKKLDFLMQEINREINTVASKTASLFITDKAVEMKTVAEKIREQIQNAE